MSYACVRDGNKQHVYRVSYNAGASGQATRVKFGPKDGWHGDDYWSYVETIDLTYHDRAMAAMGYFERRGRTECRWYKIVQRIACKRLMTDKAWRKLNRSKPV